MRLVKASLFSAGVHCADGIGQSSCLGDGIIDFGVGICYESQLNAISITSPNSKLRKHNILHIQL